MPFLIVFSFGFLLHILYGVLAPYRDSGDLVASACSLGIAHPPGYCFYVLITKIGMMMFQFANYAYRANLLSALWTALTVGILFKIFRRFVSWQTAFLAVMFWFFSPAVIQLSVVSEMYSLNALFCAIILWILLSENNVESTGIDSNSDQYFFLAFFVLGVGLANQPTLIFMLPGILFYWQSTKSWKWNSFKTFSFFVLFGFLGFLLIVYYPVRSFRDPVIDWGNPENFRALWRLITRADYGGLKLHPEQSHFFWTIQGIVEQFRLFFQVELREFNFLGCAFLFFGFLISLKQSEKWRKLNVLFGFSFLMSGPLFFILSNLPVKDQTSIPILEPYLLMVNLFALFWISLGIEKIFGVADSFAPPFSKVFGLSAVLLMTWLFGRRYSHRHEFYAYDYGKNIFKTVPLNSSFYEPDDFTAFTISYMQTAENFRKDVVPLMTLKTYWGYEQIKNRHKEIMPECQFRYAQEFIPALLEVHQQMGRPLLSDHSSKFPSSLTQYPVGLLSRAGHHPSSEEFDRIQKIFCFYIERESERGITVDRHEDFFSRHLLSRMSAALNNVGIFEQNQKKYKESERYIRQAILREPSLSAAWNNLGINYYYQKDYRSAEKIFEEGIKKAKETGMLYYHLALTQKMLNKKEESKNSLIESLKLQPENVAAINELGLIYMNERKWNESKLKFEKAVEFQKSYIPAYYNLGIVYRALGEKKKSAENFSRYLQLSPQAEDASQVQLWIQQLLGT